MKHKAAWNCTDWDWVEANVTDPDEVELYSLIREYDSQNLMRIARALRGPHGKHTKFINGSFIGTIASIRTVKDLMSASIDDIYEHRGIGDKALAVLAEIKGVTLPVKEKKEKPMTAIEFINKTRELCASHPCCLGCKLDTKFGCMAESHKFCTDARYTEEHYISAEDIVDTVRRA